MGGSSLPALEIGCAKFRLIAGVLVLRSPVEIRSRVPGRRRWLATMPCALVAVLLPL